VFAIPLSAFAICRAFPGSDYHADSATPRPRQPASGLAGPPPAARRLRGTSHVHRDPFDRVGSRLYPCSTSGKQSQHLPAIEHRSGRARSDLPSSRARSLLRPTHVRQVWGWSANRGASITALRSLCLSVSLARTRASGSTARPSRCQGCSTAVCAIPHHGCPQLHRAAASARGRPRR
jgi:hypothetical protein